MAEAEGSSYSKCRKETQEKPNAAEALAQEARQTAQEATPALSDTYTAFNKEKLNKHDLNKHKPNKHVELNKEKTAQEATIASETKHAVEGVPR